MPYDPKPAKRYRATLEEWAWFRTWFKADCCWVCAGAWQELHHIYPRSQGGDDDIVNLAPLCRECHRQVTEHEGNARSLIRGALMPTNLAYLHDKLGEQTLGWLERNYPVREAA